MKKFMFSFTWLVVLLLLPVSNAFAKEDATQFVSEVPTPEVGEQYSQQLISSEIVRPANAIDLEPAEDTSPIFDEAYWYVNEKGESVQVTGLKVSPQDRGKSYKVTLDLEENEYTVEESRNSLAGILPLATSQYTMGARYSTVDPVNVVLNRSIK
jgi:hypothetical protein